MHGLPTGAIVADNSIAFADPVRVDAPAPADFTEVVKKVSPAVVSVQVKTEAAPVDFRGRSFRRGMPDLPEDHPFNEFFKRFGEPRDFDHPRRRGRRFRTSQRRKKALSASEKLLNSSRSRAGM